MLTVEYGRAAEIAWTQLREEERRVVKAAIDRVAKDQAPSASDWRVRGLDGVYVATADEFRVVYHLQGQVLEVQDIMTGAIMAAYRHSE